MESVIQVVRGLPADIPAAVFIVIHFPANAPSVLPKILARHSQLRVAHAVDDALITPGFIYVAPPDKHLLIREGRVKLSVGPKENGHRPSVDPMFRSAARVYGPAVIGVILSGVLDDGTAGLMVVKSHGGRAVVQNPDDALYSGMPKNAIENVDIDHVVPLSVMSGLLDRLAREPVPAAPEESPDDRDIVMEDEITDLTMKSIHNSEQLGPPSSFTCPECGGTLFEMEGHDLPRFRCRVGHAYSPDSLMSAQSEALEAALWGALRALQERSALSSSMAQRAARRGQDLSAAQFTERHHEAEHHAAILLDLLLHNNAAEESSGMQNDTPNRS